MLMRAVVYSRNMSRFLQVAVLKYWTNIVRVYIVSVVKRRKFISHSGRSFNWKSSYISLLKNSFQFRSLKPLNALYLRFHCASAPRRSTRVTFLWSEKRRSTMTIVCLTLQRELTKLPRISVGRRNRWMILSRLSGSKVVKEVNSILKYWNSSWSVMDTFAWLSIIVTRSIYSVSYISI